MVKNNKLEVDKRFPLIKKENEGILNVNELKCVCFSD